MPDSTPPGITLVDVVELMNEASPEFIWRRLGDADGKPLYTYDADAAGKSSCYDECAKEFIPLEADARAKAFSDWSIVLRDDHVKQWAYQGKPLYRYSGTDPLGEPQSSNFGSGEQASWHDPSSSVYSPKRGWRRAGYSPEKTLAMPTALQVDLLAVAGGFGFVDAATRLTAYAVPVSHKVSSDWKPVRAAALAVPLGDFSIVIRKEDGTRQWTYKGEALYTYAGDYTPGDVNGIFTADKSIQAALAYHNFLPPGLSVGNYIGRGPLMTNAKGLTLYYAARYHKVFGGREGPVSYSLSYNDLKSQGTVACEANCALTWKPLLASANAQASGFWELIARADGSKQWVYKGSPVYTYFDDKKPGDIEGNNRSVILYGGAQGEVTYADAGTGPHGPQHLGKLTMLDAVGRPNGVATYVAGAGFTGDEAGRNGGAGNQRRGGAPGAPVLGRSGPPDAGAGFYWHTVPLF
jgi:predicted lipoprotein with Yx(FWY)xxD motif